MASCLCQYDYFRHLSAKYTIQHICTEIVDISGGLFVESFFGTWRVDLERTERNLFGAIDTDCWRRTWFSDSKFAIFSSSLNEKSMVSWICVAQVERISGHYDTLSRIPEADEPSFLFLPTFYAFARWILELHWTFFHTHRLFVSPSSTIAKDEIQSSEPYSSAQSNYIHHKKTGHIVRLEVFLPWALPLLLSKNQSFECLQQELGFL